MSGSASSILERAKGQLQGRRYGVVTRSAGSLNKTAPVPNNEEDDLNVSRFLSPWQVKHYGSVIAKSSELVHGNSLPCSNSMRISGINHSTAQACYVTANLTPPNCEVHP